MRLWQRLGPLAATKKHIARLGWDRRSAKSLAGILKAHREVFMSCNHGNASIDRSVLWEKRAGRCDADRLSLSAMRIGFQVGCGVTSYDFGDGWDQDHLLARHIGVVRHRHPDVPAHGRCGD